MISIVGTFVLILSLALAKYQSDVYPTHIAKFEIRRDVYTNKSVHSGLLHSLPPKNTLDEFYRHLQCPRTQPNFNYNTGLVSILRLLPPVSDVYKMVCAAIESRSNAYEDFRGWDVCRKEKETYESGNYRKDENFNLLTIWSRAHIYRVLNGTLHMDWPWGLERFVEQGDLGDTIVPLMKVTLERISDMKDSVFFVGGDTPGLTGDFPIPQFSHSTSDFHVDMVWPWYEMWQDANKAYKKIRDSGLEFSDEAFEKTEVGYLSWDKKVPKAAYFSTMQNSHIRQFMFEVARLHPDMFDAAFNEAVTSSWNPLSTEEDLSFEELEALAKNASAVAAAQSLPPGFTTALANLSLLGEYRHYYPGSYKYVVVPLSAGLATSNRLQRILTHSGAVVLMQRSMTKFHVSAQMKPWVHYVPLSYSGADIGEKVQWLRDHDDLARQIAENGRNFARSYLRLEDFYCYAASALEMLGELTGGEVSDAARTVWQPVDLPRFRRHYSDASFQ